MQTNTTPWDTNFTPADAQIIKNKARTLVGHYGWKSQDVEQLEQEISIRVWQANRKLEASCGSRGAYVKTVVNNTLCNLIAHHTAARRCTRHTHNLDAAMDVLIDDSGSIDAIDLRLDMQEALDRAPTEQREFAELAKAYRKSEIEQLTTKTRAEVRTQVKHLQSTLAHVKKAYFPNP